MTVLIHNCFNWIGFHLIQAVLEKGYMVEGIDDLKTDKQNHLAMFMGRNADFQLLQSTQVLQHQSQYDIRIQVGASGRPEVRQNGYLRIHNNAQFFTIRLPLLFGPWMPMTEAGMFRVNGEWVQFDSKTFKQEAFCIENYMGLLVHWLENNQLKNQYTGLEQDNEINIDSKMIQTGEALCNDLQRTQTHFLNHRSFY